MFTPEETEGAREYLRGLVAKIAMVRVLRQGDPYHPGSIPTMRALHAALADLAQCGLDGDPAKYVKPTVKEVQDDSERLHPDSPGEPTCCDCGLKNDYTSREIDGVLMDLCNRCGAVVRRPFTDLMRGELVVERPTSSVVITNIEEPTDAEARPG